jgi:cytochrome c oxidase subunit 1
MPKWLWPITLFLGTGLVCWSAGFFGTAMGGAVDIPIHDTYFVIDHGTWYWALALPMGTFGAIYWVFKALLKRSLDHGLGILHFACTLPVILFLAASPILTPLAASPSRYHEYTEFDFEGSWMDFNTHLSALLVMAAIGQVSFIINMVRSFLRPHSPI